jgi:hypothetical protein
VFGYDGFVSDTSSAGTQDQLVGLVLDRTSFYAEAGGQVHPLPMSFCLESLCGVGKISVGDMVAEPTQALDLHDACERLTEVCLVSVTCIRGPIGCTRAYG